MWKWKVFGFVSRGGVRRYITEERHSLHHHNNHQTSVPFLLWFNQEPGQFTPGPSGLTAWSPRHGTDLLTVGHSKQQVGSVRPAAGHWGKDGYWDVGWDLANVVHYSALLAAGFNLVHHQHRLDSVRRGRDNHQVPWDPGQLCPVTAVARHLAAQTVKAQQEEGCSSSSSEGTEASQSRKLVESQKIENKNPANLVAEDQKVDDDTGSGETKRRSEEVAEAEAAVKQAHDDILKEIESLAALDLLKSGNGVEGIGLLKKAARSGTASAYFYLGNASENGIGVGKNLHRAAEYYQKASSLGHPEAIYNLAVFHSEGLGGLEKSEEKTLRLLQEASEKNVPEARAALGLEEEVEVSDEDLDQSKESANSGGSSFVLSAGDQASLLNLAVSLDTGNTSVGEDKVFAMELLRIVADNGGGHRGAEERFYQILDEITKEKEEADKEEEVGTDGVAASGKLNRSPSSPALQNEAVKMATMKKTAGSCHDFEMLCRRASADSGVETAENESKILPID